jgi:hypothetical protein
MESAKESIRMDLVSRAVATGLAFIATSVIFTSVTLVFTTGASASAQALSQVAHTAVVQPQAGA